MNLPDPKAIREIAADAVSFSTRFDPDTPDYRRAVDAAECSFKDGYQLGLAATDEQATGEIERLRVLCRDKENHLDGYRRAADEDRAVIRRMAGFVREVLRDHRRSHECIGDTCGRCLEAAEILRGLEETSRP